MKQSIITFTGGMNTDLDNSLISQEMYRYASNFRLGNEIFRTSGNTGALETVLGNVEITGNPLTQGEIVAQTSLRDWAIIFVTDGIISSIYKLKLNSSNESCSSFILIYTDVASVSKLGISKNTKIISRYENEDVQKIYWTAENQPLRFLNIQDNNLGVEASHFDIVKDSDMISPEILGLVEGGAHKAGKIQYFYTLFNKHGAETGHSTMTPLFPLQASSIDTAENQKFTGSERGDDIHKSVRVHIPIIDTRYDYIRLYSVFYSTYNSIPQVKLVSEQKRNSTSVIIVDTGSYITTIPLEELNPYSSSVFSAKHIDTKDNILFASNIEEEDFDVDFDARAYRFDTGGVSRIHETTDINTSRYIEINTNGTWQEYFSNGELNREVHGLNWEIPKNHNCINRTTNAGDGPDNDGPNGIEGGIYLRNVNFTFGGTGRWVSYTQNFTENVLHNNATFNGTEFINQEIFINTVLTPSYKIGEIYRFGLVFFNKKMKPSPVKWIGDIKIVRNNSYYTLNNSRIFSRNIELRFSINLAGLSIEDRNKISGVQIVRTRRESFDKSIIASGVIAQLHQGTITSGNKFRYSPIGVPNSYSPTANEFGTVDYISGYLISPDVTINKLDFSLFKNLKLKFNYFIERAIDQPSRPFSYWRHNGTPGFTSDFTALDLRSLTAFLAFSCTVTPISAPVISIEDIKTAPYNLNSGDNNTLELADIVIGVSGGQYTFNNYAMSTTHGARLLSSACAPFLLTSPIFNTMQSLSTGKHYFFFVDVVRNIINSQYGGVTYEARQNNRYIAASGFIRRSSDPLITNIDITANRGDTYITMYQHMTAMNHSFTNSAVEDAKRQILMYIPVESSINNFLVLTKPLSYMNNPELMPPSSGIQETQEAGIRMFPNNYPLDLKDLYRYNSVYSQEAVYPEFYSDPSIRLFQFKNDVKIKASDKKLNGELIDSWSKFRPNNFIEVDASHGEITDLRTFANKLYYWQPKAFGILSVNDRSLVSDNNLGELVLGTGGILDRYDYLSDRLGASNFRHVALGEGSIIWYDKINHQLLEFSDRLKYLDIESGIKTEINNLPRTDNVLVFVDKKNREILFSFPDNKCLVFNQKTQRFYGYYTYTPSLIFNGYEDNTLYSIDSNIGHRIYQHDSTSVDRANFYGNNNPSELLLIANDDFDSTKVFDNILFTSKSLEVIGNSTITNFRNTFNNIQFYNDHQNTGEYTIVTDTPTSNLEIEAERREREWRINIPRNIVSESIENDVDIFNENNLDRNRQFKERMRSNYLNIRLVHSNENGNYFSIPYVKIVYRNSIR